MKSTSSWGSTCEISNRATNIHYLSDSCLYEVCIVQIDWPDPCWETSVSKLTPFSLLEWWDDEHLSKKWSGWMCDGLIYTPLTVMTTGAPAVLKKSSIFFICPSNKSLSCKLRIHGSMWSHVSVYRDLALSESLKKVSYKVIPKTKWLAICERKFFYNYHLQVLGREFSLYVLHLI